MGNVYCDGWQVGREGMGFPVSVRDQRWREMLDTRVRFGHSGRPRIVQASDCDETMAPQAAFLLRSSPEPVELKRTARVCSSQRTDLLIDL